jgi:hypothetical protein
MIGYLWLGWQVPWDVWVALMALVGFCSLLWSLRPLNLRKMAHRLDKLLSLRSQLITAFEVSSAANSSAYADSPVAQQLIQDTVKQVVQLRRQITLMGHGFWLEMHALIAIAAILGALLIFDALTPNLPKATEIDLPLAGQEPRADEIIPPEPVLPPPFQEPISQAQLQAALEALADALRDQAVTRAAAEAIDRGDLGGAAEELRRLADRLEGLSESAQQQLGEALQEAAENIGENVPNLSQPSAAGGNALERGNVQAAGQALEELAEALDSLDQNQVDTPQAGSDSSGETGETEAEQGDGGQEGGDQANGGGNGAGGGGAGEGQDELLEEEEERLPIDGEPLELENDSTVEDRVLQPSELDAEPDDNRRTSDSPFARQPLNAPADDLGPDSLNYPWEKRDIVRRYFTP